MSGACAALLLVAAAPAFAADAAAVPQPAASSPAPQAAVLPVQITRQPPADSGRLKFRGRAGGAGCGCTDSLSEQDIARGAAPQAAAEGGAR
ncbi:hypothetical protein CKO44_21035 [Rubrivivax gelatinosus]|uniref:Uncharacterized protein n=1 Tax=Rubrivivax gelatinosus TaxID=28068 RepID=A0ABS1DQ95_RUBGE|nr:hypothetical protein [Rubrivivax gelatinosus]MBK1711896.1 hypothetical protein [Rubrivivax gelatinosus]